VEARVVNGKDEWGEYDQGTWHTCVKIEQWSLLKLF
jgi:hypothetical protein